MRYPHEQRIEKPSTTAPVAGQTASETATGAARWWLVFILSTFASSRVVRPCDSALDDEQPGYSTYPPIRQKKNASVLRKPAQPLSYASQVVEINRLAEMFVCIKSPRCDWESHLAKRATRAGRRGLRGLVGDRPESARVGQSRPESARVAAKRPWSAAKRPWGLGALPRGLGALGPWGLGALPRGLGALGPWGLGALPRGLGALGRYFLRARIAARTRAISASVSGSTV
jgi:hypothetical protein